MQKHFNFEKLERKNSLKVFHFALDITTMLSILLVLWLITCSQGQHQRKGEVSDEDLKDICNGLFSDVRLPERIMSDLAIAHNGPFILERRSCSHFNFTFIKINVVESAHLMYMGHHTTLENVTNQEAYMLRVHQSSEYFSKFVSPPTLALIIRNKAKLAVNGLIAQGGISIPFDLSPAEGRFMLLHGIKWENWPRTSLELNVTQNPRILVTTTQFLVFSAFCAPKQTEVDCRPIFEREHATCICGPQRPTSIVPTFILSTAAVVCLTLVVFFSFFHIQNDKDIGSDETLYITCSQRTAKFQYDLCFILGCPSVDMDDEPSSLDFTLLDSVQKGVCQCRIATKNLLVQGITGVHFDMFRLTALSNTTLGAVSFTFSGGSLTPKVYFYGILITDIASNNSYNFPVNKYIRPVVMTKPLIPASRMRPPDPRTDEIPEIFAPQLYSIEKAVILCFAFTLSGLVCIVFLKINVYLATIFTVVISLALLETLMAIYGHIKKNLVKEKLLTEVDSITWKIGQYGCFTLMIVFSMLIALGTYQVDMLQVTVEKYPNWMGSTFFTFAILVAVTVLLQAFSSPQDSLINKFFSQLERRESSSRIDIATRSMSRTEMSVQTLGSAKSGLGGHRRMVSRNKPHESNLDAFPTVGSILSRFEHETDQKVPKHRFGNFSKNKWQKLEFRKKHAATSNNGS